MSAADRAFDDPPPGPLRRPRTRRRCPATLGIGHNRYDADGDSSDPPYARTSRHERIRTKTITTRSSDNNPTRAGPEKGTIMSEVSEQQLEDMEALFVHTAA